MVATSKWLVFVFCLLLAACGNGNNANPAPQPNTNVDTTTVAHNAKTKTISFFGNSLTAGYGLDVAQAFPALIQQKIDSLELPYLVVNAGVSGETSAGG